MSESLQVGVVAFAGVVISSALVAIIQGWLKRRENIQLAEIRKAERQEEHERQDAVADRLLQANQKVADQAELQSRQLGQIHTLVNSDKTTAMEVLHTTELTLLSVSLEVVSLKRELGIEPTEETLANLEAIRDRIHSLEIDLSTRAEQSALVEAQGEAIAAQRSDMLAQS